MGKKLLKSVAFPVGWDTSPPDTSVSQVPKERSHELISQSAKPSRTQGTPRRPEDVLDSEDHHRCNRTAPTTGSGVVHTYKEPNSRRLNAAVDEPGGWSWRPDVYAQAFVPESLSAINRSRASMIHTPGVEGIDYGDYISTFAGNQFLALLDPPRLRETSHRLSVNTLDHLNPKNYGEHFRDCLAWDMNARIPEIRSYDIFAATLETQHLTPQVYSLSVPGLRDGTPPISFSDSVLLRQLILDPATGLPWGMSGWLAPGGGLSRGLQAPGFTGYEISAVVLAIDRAKELLYLRAYGLVLAGNPICNVSFVVQSWLTTGVQRAVADVAEQLTREFGLIQPANIKLGPTGAFIRKSDVPHQHPGPRTEQTAVNAAFSNGKQYPTTPMAMQSGTPTEQHVIGGDVSQSKVKNLWLQRMLFPQEANGVQQKDLPSVAFPQCWFDTNLNYEQKKAVNAVQSKNYGDFCYLVNGPPGGGKTKTMCEMVAQLGKDPEFHGSILLCAPSNPAADTLALRLKSYFEPRYLLRLNHFSRTFAEVPQELLPYCYVKDDFFNLPPLSKLMRHKVVVTTCQAADILVQARVTNRDLTSLQNDMISTLNPGLMAAQAPLHWAGLLIDEAAQATEPESLIPLTVVSPPPLHPRHECPIFVMAGDQHQLNPRTYHEFTTLHISLFERLSNTSVYASHPLARKTLHRTTHHSPMLRPPFVNLVRNYRSHPAILAVPSSMFYENTLIPEAFYTESLLSWSVWRGRRWPVLFACNGGIDDCEDIRGVGGGWYNTREASKAIAYARDLLAQSLISNQSEICIMSPFPSQVHLLRRLARQSKLWAVNIGPMEAFQGLESRFVIVCTTRARKRFLGEDELRGLGIVKEKKKFNVAITRAKEGLVVLGNPWVLATDPCWLTFMQFCWRNSLWQGEDASFRVQDFEEATVDEWRPPYDPVAISGLEAALVFRDRDQEAGSQAARRFMNGSEGAEEALWRSGLEAEEALDISGLNIIDHRTDFADEASGEGNHAYTSR